MTTKMQLTLQNGRLVASNVPESLSVFIQRWFKGVVVNATTYIIPAQESLAFQAHFKDSLEVDPAVVQRINNSLDYNHTFSRIGQWVKDYRGGYQAPVISRAVENKQRLIGAAAGGGKTIMGLELAYFARPMVAIVPPLIVRNAWLDDWQKFYSSGPHKLRVATALGGKTARERKSALRSDADLYIVSPYLIGGLVSELLDLPKASMLIDESSLFRNPESTLSTTVHKLAHTADYRYCLAANPSPSHPGEFWSQMQFINPGGLGSYNEFGKQYGTRTKYGYIFNDPDKNKAVLEQISDYVEVIPKKVFWPDAPPQRHIVIPVTMKPDQRRYYDEMQTNLRVVIAGKEIDAVADMARVMKLREATCGFMYDERKRAHSIGAVKLDALGNLLRNVIRGEQVMIWCHFDEEIDMVCNCLNRWGYQFGLLNKQDRESITAMRAFQEGRLQILISHPKTAGHGLRFHNCRNMIYMSLDYSVDTFEDSLSRIHRPPQTLECRYYYLIAKDTIDEDLYQVCHGNADWKDVCAKILGRV